MYYLHYATTTTNNFLALEVDKCELCRPLTIELVNWEDVIEQGWHLGIYTLRMGGGVKALNIRGQQLTAIITRNLVVDKTSLRYLFIYYYLEILNSDSVA